MPDRSIAGLPGKRPLAAPASAAILAVALLIATCSAPRDNPLDPNLGGNIEGRVMTRFAHGISGAEVLVPGADRVVYTDTAGRFGLYGLPEGSQRIIVGVDNYAPESSRLTLARGRIDDTTFYLNGLPRLADCDITTHVYGHGWPPNRYYFKLSTVAGDQDGETDLDSVWAEAPDLDYRVRMDYDPNLRLFTRTLPAESLPGEQLETLVGRPVLFCAADKEGIVTRSPSVYLSRIIAYFPEQAFPASGFDTLRSDTLFFWRTFDHGFWVRYYCEITRIESGSPAGTAGQFSTSSPLDTSFRFATSALDTGDYYWTVEAIDAFGNSIRSPEARFHR